MHPVGVELRGEHACAGKKIANRPAGDFKDELADALIDGGQACPSLSLNQAPIHSIAIALSVT